MATAATINIAWLDGFSSAAARSTSAATVDTLSFTWTGSHNVYSMPSEAAFDGCDFSGATNLGASSPVTQALSGSGPWYFACRVGSHCSSGQKLAATASNNAPTNAPTNLGDTNAPSSAPTSGPTQIYTSSATSV